MSYNIIVNNNSNISIQNPTLNGYEQKNFSHLYFLAPTGAQGVTMSVRLSGTSLSKTLNLHLSLIMSVSDQSQVSLRSL